MKRPRAVTLLLAVSAATVLIVVPTLVAQPRTPTAAASASTFPDWAYPWDPDFKPHPADDEPRRVPGSTATYTTNQARDLFLSPDWHPADHPPMPEVVARGRKPDVFACGCCHRAEGTGGPENASLAGLPAAYIIQQMADYKSGVRTFAGPARGPVIRMIAVAKATTDAEVQAAAKYFSSLKPKANIKVIEADVVPKTIVAANFRAPAPGGGEEPLGERIIEMPVNVEQFELRDSRATFVAYVPKGSIARGRALAKTGGDGLTVACSRCHGSNLKGAGAVPSIVGRSPSYIARQLQDMKSGARAGVLSPLMKPSVMKLTNREMIALAAYLASQTP